MDTKDRFIAASADLFARQGYSGTGLKQIVAHAGATWGSVYHHFPGGKEELGVEAVRHAGARDEQRFQTAFERADGAGQAVEAIFSAEIKRLEASDYADGCAVASVAADVVATTDEVRAACAAAFVGWRTAISAALRKENVSDQEAELLASVIISALEGATLISRAQKSPRAMQDARTAMRRLVDDAVRREARG